LFSSEEPDRLRAPNLDFAWVDELTSMPNAQQVWDMLQFATRLNGPLGDPAQIVLTTTPKPGSEYPVRAVVARSSNCALHLRRLRPGGLEGVAWRAMRVRDLLLTDRLSTARTALHAGTLKALFVVSLFWPSQFARS
jgi:Terminase large subunit, T4likevirus-type, N-terminal